MAAVAAPFSGEAVAEAASRAWAWAETFEPPVTKADWPYPVCSVAAYLLTLYFIKAWAAKRKAAGLPLPQLRAAMKVHNLALSAGSLALFAAFVGVLVPMWWRLGSLFNLACSPEMGEPGVLYLLYYINYFFKYYEFADTFFMALRGKETPFLHVYHHAATLMLVYVSLTERLGVAWLPVTINLFVHVIMYWYYALQAMGIRVWWKKHVTTLQIAQFVIDLYGCYFCYTWRMLYGRDSCQGTDFGAVVGCAILSSYLLLFIQFFVNTYTVKKPGDKKKAAAAKAD